MIRLLPVALALLLAAPAMAQVRPQPGIGDPHIQTVTFKPDQVVQLSASPGYQLMVELAPDEQIQTVAVGDSGSWQVSANRAGNQLFVKPLQTGAGTNMTVVTSVRVYNFELSAAGGASGAYTVRFTYPATPPLVTVTDDKMVGLYRLSGTRALRPAGISDDGAKTYIVWPDDAALPAVYILDGHGKEALANGNMRDGFYVIDSVNRNLVFRIDKQVARAFRFIDRRKP